MLATGEYDKNEWIKDVKSSLRKAKKTLKVEMNENNKTKVGFWFDIFKFWTKVPNMVPTEREEDEEDEEEKKHDGQNVPIADEPRTKRRKKTPAPPPVPTPALVPAPVELPFKYLTLKNKQKFVAQPGPNETTTLENLKTDRKKFGADILLKKTWKQYRHDSMWNLAKYCFVIFVTKNQNNN